MRNAKIEDIPRKEIKIINAGVEKYSADVQKIVDKDYGPSPRVFFGIIGFIVLIAITGIWINGYSRGSMLFGFDQPGMKYSVHAQRKVSATVYNQSDYTPLSFDKLEYPQFFSTELHNYETKDITKKLLADRTVKVTVKADKNGKIIEAKAENGHEYLKNICEEAALKSSFYPPADGNITIVYSFSVIE